MTTEKIENRKSKIENRAGMSLLEVLIALAIFLAATAMIGQLVSTGSQAAIGAQFKAEAARRCETVMAEAVAGTIPLESTGATPFEDDPEWSWLLTVTDGPIADLLQVQATVTRPVRYGQPPVQFTLVRWVRNPELWTQSTVSSTTGTTTSSTSTGAAP
jgi:prepilin-type N-terminal cleavage/methylation domain-containing protein